jgi:hypothetical protein
MILVKIIESVCAQALDLICRGPENHGFRPEKQSSIPKRKERYSWWDRSADKKTQYLRESCIKWSNSVISSPTSASVIGQTSSKSLPQRTYLDVMNGFKVGMHALQKVTFQYLESTDSAPRQRPEHAWKWGSSGSCSWIFQSALGPIFT